MRRGNNPKTKLESETLNPPLRRPDTNNSKVTLTPRFIKPPRLIEKATTQPIEVINEVFDQVSLSDLTDYLLPNWRRVAIINTQSPYSYENGRALLYEFYEQLITIVTQLHLASKNQQLANPSSPFTGLFQLCPSITCGANWPISWKPALAMIASILTASRPGKPGWRITTYIAWWRPPIGYIPTRRHNAY
jgi:hypothetical protein